MTRALAAFDFDGTLSSRDNVLAYLRIVAGTRDLARAIAAVAPALLAARRDPSQRDVAKAVVLRRTLAGRREDYLRDLGARYARLVVLEHLHSDVVARLDAHRAAGHDLVLVSASLRLYLDPIAELLEVPNVLATAMEVAPDGRLTGELAGANVRGPEKARRLDEWIAQSPRSPARRQQDAQDGETAAGGEDGGVVVYAYGDSDGDRELLARADHPIRVDRYGRLPYWTPER